VTNTDVLSRTTLENHPHTSLIPKWLAAHRELACAAWDLGKIQERCIHVDDPMDGFFGIRTRRVQILARRVQFVDMGNITGSWRRLSGIRYFGREL
jgi:hypothetical protein